jgi:hypothetical protein
MVVVLDDQISESGFLAVWSLLERAEPRMIEEWRKLRNFPHEPVEHIVDTLKSLNVITEK